MFIYNIDNGALDFYFISPQMHIREVSNLLINVLSHFLSKLQVANLACSISNNEEGVKLVRMAATQIDSLCPQVRDGVAEHCVLAHKQSSLGQKPISMKSIERDR